MATSASRPISNIAVAFAAQAAASDVPPLRDAGIVTTPDDSKQHNPHMLLTPPNSISPTLPPHNHRPGIPATRSPHPPQFDSDIDLQDAVEHAKAQDQPTALSRAALSGLEAAGAITPSMLAKHHLPEILLLHGPMAIRHVLNHLAQSVPGFSRIPPAKARRLVVAALESRAGGGVKGEVEFEKVGWGRWDAREKGQPPRDGRPVHSVPIGSHGVLNSGMSPPASIPESYAVSSVGGLQIPQTGRYKRDIYSGSWAGESLLSFREDVEMADMAEHEADKMSLDGSDSSEMADIPGLEDDLDDVTDHEDWSAIGPDALRQSNQSYGRRYAHRDYNFLSRTSGVRAKPHQARSFSAQSMPLSRAGSKTPAFLHNNPPSSSLASRSHAGNTFNHHASSTGVSGVIGQDSQERDAIEALLRMGSM